MTAKSVRVALAVALVVAVYVALYAQARRFELVWADADAIQHSPVYDLPFAAQLRVSEHARMNTGLTELHGLVLTHESYRPLLILSHSFDVHVFGRDASGAMHVHNLVLGALGILAAFWLAVRILGAALPALFVTAAFAWHPLHVEPICFVSARGDPLAGLLALVAAALVVEGVPIAAGAVFLLSLFAKEANVLLPLALAAIALALGRLRAWRNGLLALAAAIPVYAVTRAFLVAHAPAATHADRLGRALAGFPAIVAEYARTFVLPFDISISRPLYVAPALGWALAAIAIAGTIVALRRAPAAWRSPVALAAAGVVAAALFIAPATVAVFSEHAVADRYAYLAVFGFALVPAALGAHLVAARPRSRAGVCAAGALFLGLCLFVSAREIPAWSTSGTLFAHAVAVEPNTSGAHYRLGSWLAQRGAWPDAVREFEAACALPGAGDRDLNNLGVAYLNVGRTRDAVTTLQRAIDQSRGSSFHGWYNLGTAQRLLGELDAACASYRHALALDPGYAHARADAQRYCN